MDGSHVIYMRYIMLALICIVVFSGCAATEERVDCNKITVRDEADDCYLNQSVTRLDASGCEEILDPKMQVECIDLIALELADYNACRAHDRRPDQDRCEVKVGNLRKKMAK